jgi:hypothetical protein
MKSITYWNRLEPRPRGHEVLESLQARVRDPLWFLARQFQLGEFQGEDAASPAWIQMAYRLSPFTTWAPRGAGGEVIDMSTPLEELTQSEAFSGHLALRVELGQLAETLLEDQGLSADVIGKVRAAYPIPVPAEGDIALDPDGAEARFARVVGGRSCDGLTLYWEAVAAAPALPARLTTPPNDVPGPDRSAVIQALGELARYVDRVYEAVGDADAPAWRAERLEYDLDIEAREAGGGLATFDAEPSSDGSFDWYAFDLQSRRGDEGGEGDRGIVATTRSVMPTHVRFRGMPNHRWWDFESGLTDFGAVEPDTRDLARLLVVDFMTVSANDWFVAPLVMPVGALCQIDLLLVHDVFGGRTVVPNANDVTGDPSRRWAMFASASTAGATPFFMIPPSAATTVQQGETIEEVRLLRDEMANMVWAIEHRLQAGTGEGVAGHERAVRHDEIDNTAPEAGGPLLRYQLETLVPEYWIPMLPVAIDPVNGDIALERGVVVRARDDGTLFTLPPRGRVLNPTGVAPYRVREEEVTRAGTRVLRVPCRTRWLNGQTYVWIARRKTVGSGEGSSGLKYDLARFAQQGE